MDNNILKKKELMVLRYQEKLEVHYITRNYLSGPALKYTKMTQSNYLKTSLV